MRMLESSGSSLYGHVAPAPVMVTPAPFANATVLLAVFGNPSKLTKYPPSGLLQLAQPVSEKEPVLARYSWEKSAEQLLSLLKEN